MSIDRSSSFGLRKADLIVGFVLDHPSANLTDEILRDPGFRCGLQLRRKNLFVTVRKCDHNRNRIVITLSFSGFRPFTEEYFHGNRVPDIFFGFVKSTFFTSHDFTGNAFSGSREGKTVFPVKPSLPVHALTSEKSPPTGFVSRKGLFLRIWFRIRMRSSISRIGVWLGSSSPSTIVNWWPW